MHSDELRGRTFNCETSLMFTGPSLPRSGSVVASVCRDETLASATFWLCVPGGDFISQRPASLVLMGR